MLELVKRAKELINSCNDAAWENSIGVLSADGNKMYITMYEEKNVGGAKGLGLYGSVRIFVGDSRVSLSYMPMGCVPKTKAFDEIMEYIISELENIYERRKPNDTVDIFKTDDVLAKVFEVVYKNLPIHTDFIEKSELEKNMV